MQEHDYLPLEDFQEFPEKEMLTRAKQFYQEIKTRHSVRDFSDRPVDRKIIDECIKVAGTAPIISHGILR